jgi:ubiquinone/menaquinone biosynthesis C-methylase UbiE
VFLVVELVKKSLALSEIENLGYYDFMAYLEVPFFNIGGTPSMDLLAERCSLDEFSHVLDVGCGTGGNAAYLARKIGCKVTGIDISDLMIEQAKKRIENLDLDNRLNFFVGDAYHLDFQDETFDAVLTVFVSQFLDLERAFPEFMRVLKKGGFLGVNEMYREIKVPAELVDKVDNAEQVFMELTELPFKIRSPDQWRQGFEYTGFEDICVEAFSELINVNRGLEMIEEFGGWLNLISILWRTAVLGLRSKKIRNRYGKMNKGKRVMLRDKKTSKCFGYVLGVGKKAID